MSNDLKKTEGNMNNIVKECEELGGDIVFDGDKNSVSCKFKKEGNVKILKAGEKVTIKQDERNKGGG